MRAVLAVAVLVLAGCAHTTAPQRIAAAAQRAMAATGASMRTRPSFTTVADASATVPAVLATATTCATSWTASPDQTPKRVASRPIAAFARGRAMIMREP